MNENMQAVQNMHNIAIYAKDITLKRIDKVIIETQRDNPMLLELFRDKFFHEVHEQLLAKKKVYQIYILDLENMQKDLDTHMISATLNSFSILIAKLDIKIEEIEKKIQGVPDEEDY